MSFAIFLVFSRPCARGLGLGLGLGLNKGAKDDETNQSHLNQRDIFRDVALSGGQALQNIILQILDTETTCDVTVTTQTREPRTVS